MTCVLPNPCTALSCGGTELCPRSSHGTLTAVPGLPLPRPQRLAEQQRAGGAERLAEVEAALRSSSWLRPMPRRRRRRSARGLRSCSGACRRRWHAGRRWQDAQQQKRSIQEELQLRQSSEAEIQAAGPAGGGSRAQPAAHEEEIRVVRLQLETTERQRGGAEGERRRCGTGRRRLRHRSAGPGGGGGACGDRYKRKPSARQAEAELGLRVKAEAAAAREKQRALQAPGGATPQAEEGGSGPAAGGGRAGAPGAGGAGDSTAQRPGRAAEQACLIC